MIKALKDYHLEVSVFDPMAESSEVEHEYGISLISQISQESYDSVVLAVSHQQFQQIDYSKVLKSNGVLFDVKGVLSKEIIDGRL